MIRVLSQEPLAGAIPSAELLRLAESLDRARFASLEVSGGGVFDACVRRGVESPWERIRGIKARVKTPLALAVRGRFLVGPRPVSDELVRRFVLSAAASGIDIFRLNDPLNDVDNLRVAAEAIREAGCEFDCGLIYGSQQHDAPVAPLRPRLAVRSAQRKIPVGLIAALDDQLRASGAADRLDEILEEIERVRVEAGSAPLAAPIGQIVASQAIVNVLGANRYGTLVDEFRSLVSGRFGHTPGPIDPALARAVELLGGGADVAPADMEALRESAKGFAASEEELLLLALFPGEAEGLLRAIRQRATGDEAAAAQGVDRTREQQIRDVVRIVQETGVGEITIEEHGTRVSVRRTPETQLVAALPGTSTESPAESTPRAADGLVRVESPMVGTFYRSPQPGSPSFVEEGDAVAAGQTLCILEAMKLMNEVKAEIEAVVRKIHVGNAEPVEYGQLLFELEPLNGRPTGM